MDSAEITPDLGPLPQSDDNSEMQRRSLKELNSLLKDQDTILFRDERIEDYGVDGALELKLNGRMTNFRAQAQMKGTTSVEANKDGSISLPVRTANLNYLLNGVSPIYVLFDAKKREFWYVWAQDENRRLEAANSAWRKQQAVTLRFTQCLTTDELGGIVDRVQREGRLHRQIHDSLARATTNEPIVVSIDASSLSITDPMQAQHVLLASGPAIVAAGYPKQALHLVDLLDSTIRDLARVQLTAGYAEYMLGKHYNALGHIRQAIARTQELSDHDRTFLSRLKDACEFHVGIIDNTAYRRRADERGQALTGIESLEAQQDAIYCQCLSEHDPDIRASLTERAHGITGQILRHPEATDAIRLTARLNLLYIEGTEASLAATHQLVLSRMRAGMFAGHTSDAQQGYRQAKSRLADWEASSAEALKEAQELRHPILIGEAFTVVSSIEMGNLLDQRFDALCREGVFEVPETTISKARQDLAAGLAINKLNGTVEGRLRLNKLEADLLEIIGDVAGAKEVAARTYPEAAAMGFASIAEHAKELLEDRSLLMRFEREVASLKHADRDVWFAALSDEELHEFAREVLLSVGSPPARAEVIAQYCQSLREVAQERCRWCRHLEMLEDLTQTTDPATAFRVLPNRSCHCAKFGFRTEIVTSDSHALIETFKQIYCASCKERSPKEG